MIHQTLMKFLVRGLYHKTLCKLFVRERERGRGKEGGEGENMNVSVCMKTMNEQSIGTQEYTKVTQLLILPSIC